MRKRAVWLTAVDGEGLITGAARRLKVLDAHDIAAARANDIVPNPAPRDAGTGDACRILGAIVVPPCVRPLRRPAGSVGIASAYQTPLRGGNGVLSFGFFTTSSLITDSTSSISRTSFSSALDCAGVCTQPFR